MAHPASLDLGGPCLCSRPRQLALPKLSLSSTATVVPCKSACMSSIAMAEPHQAMFASIELCCVEGYQSTLALPTILLSFSIFEIYVYIFLYLGFIISSCLVQWELNLLLLLPCNLPTF